MAKIWVTLMAIQVIQAVTLDAAEKRLSIQFSGVLNEGNCKR